LDIRFDNAGVDFGTRPALLPLSLTLNERRIGVIGLNGSGKTTFARLINGLTKPTTGHVTVDGLDTLSDAKAVLGKVGYIFQSPQNQIILPIIRDDIAFGLKARGLGKADIETAVDGILDRFGVRHLAERRAHELSGGELQMAALCSVLVTGPDILILDEPTNGLDPRQIIEMRELIRSLAGRHTVLMSSHILSEVEKTSDRVAVMLDGRLLGVRAIADTPDLESWFLSLT